MEVKNSVRTGDIRLIYDSSVASSSSRLVPAPTGKDVMVGFDEDLMKIKARLCGESSKLRVIPICGMGGIGKTTLAINAYNDRLIQEHFHIHAWVTVSHDYTAKQILSSLVESFKELIDEQVYKCLKECDDVGLLFPATNEEKCDHRNKLMAEVVYKCLKGRRYLIVMDDMWSTEAWDDVSRLCPDDNNGSRIMLTTRLKNVAAYPTDSSSPLHEIHFMDDNQSWNLLRQKVFKQEHCPLELEDIGRMIASSCRGLPLAIVVIAGILSTVSQTHASWKNVAQNLTSAVTTNDEQFANILSLSYTHLPHHLRPCFLYMGGFPEDYKIKVSKLIKLFVAEGFLEPSGSKSYEEQAREYLKDLVERSLVLVSTMKSNGKNIKTCNLHDLVRDLCIKTAQKENFHPNQCRTGFGTSHSIGFHHRFGKSHSIASHHHRCGKLNPTISCLRPLEIMLSSFKDCKSLRVLDAVKLTFCKFPDQILELFFLRYLAFSIPDRKCIIDVPSCILKLENLQTLIIFSKITTKTGHLKSRVRLPLEIWRMTQLRHLILVAPSPLPCPPPGSFPLENLQTLAVVINFNCTESILQMIPNLRKLKVVYDGHEINWPIYHLNNLVHLHHLENLNIDVECRRIDPVPLCGKLAFPMMLRTLKLRGCCFSSQDMAIVGSLPNLQVLKLRDCFFEGGKWETIEGEFLRLKFLQINSTNLQYWITESSHFSSLECLMIFWCLDLREIPDVIGEIPTLELIEVRRWEKSLVESAQRIKEEQESFGNDSLQVRIVDQYAGPETYKDVASASDKVFFDWINRESRLKRPRVTKCDLAGQSVG